MGRATQARMVVLVGVIAALWWRWPAEEPADGATSLEVGIPQPETAAPPRSTDRPPTGTRPPAEPVLPAHQEVRHPTRPAEVQRIDDFNLWPRDPPVRYRKSVPDCWLKLTIREGKNRQVERHVDGEEPAHDAAAVSRLRLT